MLTYHSLFQQPYFILALSLFHKCTTLMLFSANADRIYRRLLFSTLFFFFFRQRTTNTNNIVNSNLESINTVTKDIINKQRCSHNGQNASQVDLHQEAFRRVSPRCPVGRNLVSSIVIIMQIQRFYLVKGKKYHNKVRYKGIERPRFNTKLCITCQNNFIQSLEM